MGDPKKIAQIFPGTGQPSSSADSSPVVIEEATKDFLRYFDATGFDTSHQYLRNFRPDNFESVAALQKSIIAVGGDVKAEEVLIGERGAKGKKGFLKQYSEKWFKKPVGLKWQSFVSDLNVANTFLKFNVEGFARYHDFAFNMQQSLYKFFELNMETCDEYIDEGVCKTMKEEFLKSGAISEHQSNFDKVTNLDRWKKMSGHQLERIWDKTGANLLRIGESKHLECQPEMQVKKGYARPGFYVYDMFCGGSIKGQLVIGNPHDGARTALRINVKGRVYAEKIEKDFEGRLQYQGTVAQESEDARVPLGSAASNGEMMRIDVEANRLDGFIVVFPDGRMKILDKRSFTLADISGRAEDRSVDLSLTANTALDGTRFIEAVRQYKITLISAALLDPRGDGTNRLKYSKKDLHSVRYIFTFQNGLFGMLNAEGDLHVNAGLDFIYGLQKNIGPLEYVVMCDRGMWDSAKLYKRDGGEDVLGSVLDDPSNRLIFYSGK